MREAVAWCLVAILLAVILLPEGPAPVDNSAALRAQNDSLRGEIEDRDYRQQLMHEAADSMRTRLDSLVNNAPAPEVRYLGWHNALRSWSTDSLWRFMGAWPADTATPRYAREMGRDKGHD